LPLLAEEPISPMGAAASARFARKAQASPRALVPAPPKQNLQYAHAERALQVERRDRPMGARFQI